MTPMQEITACMENGDVAHVPLYRLDQGYRVDINYQVKTGPTFDPHEGPVLSTPQGAFEFMLRVLPGIAEVRSTSIVELDNPCNTELLSGGDQKAILQNRGISAMVLVNGKAV